MIDLLLTAVYARTSALLWPVVLTLLFAVGYSAYLLGRLRLRHGTGGTGRVPCHP